jgi:hypothetical protein
MISCSFLSSQRIQLHRCMAAVANASDLRGTDWEIKAADEECGKRHEQACDCQEVSARQT